MKRHFNSRAVVLLVTACLFPVFASRSSSCHPTVECRLVGTSEELTEEDLRELEPSAYLERPTLVAEACDKALRSGVVGRTWQRRLMLLQASALHQMGEIEEARSIAEAVLEVWPYHTKAHLLLASIQSTQGEFEQAIESADRAHKLEPENVAALTKKALALGMDDQIGEAIVLLEGARDNFDLLDASYFSTLAHLYLQQEEFEKCISAIDRSLALDPLGHRSGVTELRYLVKGSAHIHRQEFEVALSCFSMAVQLAPASLEYRYFLWKGLRACKREQSALRQANSMIGLDPNDARSLEALATSQFAVGNILAALDVAEKWSKSHGDSAEALTLLAKCYFMEQRGHDAIASLDKVLEKRPNDLGSLLRKAQIRSAFPDDDCRDSVEALSFAGRALRLAQDTSHETRAWITMAWAHAENGDFEEATKYCQLALESDDLTTEESDLAQATLKKLQKNEPWRFEFSDYEFQ